MMRTPSELELRDLVLHQVGSLYPVAESEFIQVEAAIPAALEACEYSFSRIRNKYYSDSSSAVTLNPLHSGQWTQFLYRLSRAIYLAGGGSSMCDKVYALNRMLSSADLFYQVALPGTLFFDYPLGAVMGRAEYGEYFTFAQGCTVGNNHGIYPSFGNSVFMLSDSKVIGDCSVGDNVIIAANAYVKDTDMPSGSIVFGQSPNLVIKDNKLDYVRAYAEGVFRYE